MYLCDNNHDELCHEGMQCPACEALSELHEARKEAQSLEAELDEAKDQIIELKSELTALQNQ